MPDSVIATGLEPAAPSTNGDHEIAPPAPPEASGSNVFALFKAETTVMAWLIFLILGGGLLALYYARIRYMPNVEWSASLIYVGAATVIGGGIGLLFSMSLFLPGFIWSQSLIQDPKLQHQFCYDSGHTEVCVGTVFGYLGKPFGWALLLSHLSLVVGYSSSLNVVLFVYAIVSVALIAMLWPYMQSSFSTLELRPPHPPERHVESSDELKKEAATPAETTADDNDKELVRRNMKCGFWFVLSLVLSQISVVTMYVLSKPKSLSSFFVLTFICTAGVLLSNHVVALLYQRYSRRAILASVVAAGLLLLTADRFSPLSLRIMAYYGLGGGRTSDFVVTDEGAKIIGDLGLSLCRTRTVCGVEVLSKLGDEYYLVQDNKTFTLPKSAVQSYESTDPRSTK